MINTEVIPVADTRYLAEDTSATEIGGRDVDGGGDSSEVVFVEVKGAEDTGCED